MVLFRAVTKKGRRKFGRLLGWWGEFDRVPLHRRRGFTGIIEKAALWATDFRYLNDSKELIYAWEAFVAKLVQLSSESSEYSEAYGAQLKALQLMNAVDLMDFDDAMFVACFTELRDALSQWSRAAPRLLDPWQMPLLLYSNLSFCSRFQLSYQQ